MIERWTYKRKAELIEACRSGQRSLIDILTEHKISREEFASWVKLYDTGDIAALKATKLQKYRRSQKEATRKTSRHRPSSQISSSTKPGGAH